MKLFDLFSTDKIALELSLPENVDIEYLGDKIKTVGTQGEISKFADEIRKVSKLSDGQLARVDKYILKVSDYITEDGLRENWIELPSWGWNVIASKFKEVTCKYEENPFYFNACGCTDEIPLDIGVEVTDLPRERESTEA